jgi:hypothetical protein
MSLILTDPSSALPALCRDNWSSRRSRTHRPTPDPTPNSAYYPHDLSGLAFNLLRTSDIPVFARQRSASAVPAA